MKTSVMCFLALCLPVVLVLAGCQSSEQTLIPVTGEEAFPVPDEVLLARDNVLAYVISASRLADFPSRSEWKLDNGSQAEGEYRFSSGDWLMIVWASTPQAEDQHVIIRNQSQPAFWCGHVKPDGQVVDTAYQR